MHAAIVSLLNLLSKSGAYLTGVFIRLFTVDIYSMGIQSKLHVIKSLDSLLYYHFVYIYFLDASLLLLIFRVFLQLVCLCIVTMTPPLSTDGVLLSLLAAAFVKGVATDITNSNWCRNGRAWYMYIDTWLE